MKGKLAKLGHDIWKARTVYLLILPVVVYMLLFKYWPMYWLKISLYDYKIYKGFDGSKFVGFANFIKLFKAKDFWQMIRNVVMLNFWSLIFCFPAPIILAIMLNELRLSKVKKIVQTITFLPHFISMVAFVALVTAFLSPSTGTIGSIMKFFGMEQFGLWVIAAHWNAYMEPLMYISDFNKFTLQQVLQDIVLNADAVKYELGSATSNTVTGAALADQLKNAVLIVSMIPMLIIYPFIQKYFVKGATLGAVKG